MKIALLTIWHEKNYGAELQAYATIKYLSSLGHEVKLIDIRLADMRTYSTKGKIANFLSYFTPGDLKFRKFWKKSIPTTRRYHSLEELKHNPPEADLYVVGSDQVWNSEITKSMAPVFFLNFGNKNIKRASYASSFGVEVWNANELLTQDIRSLLQQFNYISCREISGCNILKNIFGVEATCVLDPTLLSNIFSEFVEAKTENKILVYYPLEDDKELKEYALKLSKSLGYDCIDAANRRKLFGKVEWNRNSPEQWISAIANSQLVITRSFHGVAFSIIFKRQFIVVNNTSRISRITNLLDSINLSNRCFHSFEEVDAGRPWEHPIDYKLVTPLLEKIQKDSIEFITNITKL